MNKTNFSSCLLIDEDSANEFFTRHCSSIGMVSGVEKKLEYATKTCRVGDVAVSTSTSPTGWSYEKRDEWDGFLLTIPYSGTVQWVTAKSRFASEQGMLFITDQREILRSSYSANAGYSTIFIHHDELLRYLKALIDLDPKARFRFNNSKSCKTAASFLSNLSWAILSLSSGTSMCKQPLLGNLKEALISFAIHNVENNYSEMIVSPEFVYSPTPHSVKNTIQYINENFSKTLSNMDLAARVGVSIRSLQLGFKKYRQTTLVGYIREVRLINARKLIFDANSSLSTQQVARLCGFTNYYLFCKYYTLRFSEHPREAMKKAKKPWT